MATKVISELLPSRKALSFKRNRKIVVVKSKAIGMPLCAIVPSKSKNAKPVNPKLDPKLLHPLQNLLNLILRPSHPTLLSLRPNRLSLRPNLLRHLNLSRPPQNLSRSQPQHLWNSLLLYQKRPLLLLLQHPNLTLIDCALDFFVTINFG